MAGDSIIGPSSIAPRGYAFFTAPTVKYEPGKWRWIVDGAGTISGSALGPEVKVRSRAGSGGGRVTLYLQAMTKGSWATIHQRTVKINPYPYMQLVRTKTAGSGLEPFTPGAVTGSGTLYFHSIFNAWASWGLRFVGDTSTLPKMVAVKVSFSDNGMAWHQWLDTNQTNATLMFPKNGVGTVGDGGTVLSLVFNRPVIFDDGTHSGTVSFSADGVKPMTVRILSGQ